MVRPDEQFTAAYKICQKAERELLQLLIHQQQKNSSTDAETISCLKQQLSQRFPDQSKREKAEKIIQSATNRSLIRTSLSQKRPAANRKKQPKETNELSTIKAKLNELTTLMNDLIAPPVLSNLEQNSGRSAWHFLITGIDRYKGHQKSNGTVSTC
ncbi:hypothetical protein P5673_032674 [Acropora cervicornis]|uniref:Uncharacterized protein n=1 Tax=Acropora cervicornis TaxID=6130 RepID=A0AAD9PR87_ACRCE|nr:hypothetical protein P5673_032674 [Acropora cervicornis]